MAVSYTAERAEAASTANATTYDTAAFTPTANSLLILCYSGSDAQATFSLSSITEPTGTDLTWTLIRAGAEYNNTVVWQNFGMYYCLVPASTASTVVRLTWSEALSGCHIWIGEFAGFHPTAPIAQSDVAQLAAGTETHSLPGAVDADSMTVYMNAVLRNPPAWDASGDGWTEVMDTGTNTPSHGLFVAYKANDQAIAFTGTDLTSSSIIAEIEPVQAVTGAAYGWAKGRGTAPLATTLIMQTGAGHGRANGRATAASAVVAVANHTDAHAVGFAAATGTTVVHAGSQPVVIAEDLESSNSIQVLTVTLPVTPARGDIILLFGNTNAQDNEFPAFPDGYSDGWTKWWDQLDSAITPTNQVIYGRQSDGTEGTSFPVTLTVTTRRYILHGLLLRGDFVSWVGGPPQSPDYTSANSGVNFVETISTGSTGTQDNPTSFVLSVLALNSAAADVTESPSPEAGYVLDTSTKQAISSARLSLASASKVIRTTDAEDVTWTWQDTLDGSKAVATALVIAARSGAVGRARTWGAADASTFVPTVDANPAAGRAAGRGTASGTVTITAAASGRSRATATAAATVVTASSAQGYVRGRGTADSRCIVRGGGDELTPNAASSTGSQNSSGSGSPATLVANTLTTYTGEVFVAGIVMSRRDAPGPTTPPSIDRVQGSLSGADWRYIGSWDDTGTNGTDEWAVTVALWYCIVSEPGTGSGSLSVYFGTAPTSWAGFISHFRNGARGLAQVGTFTPDDTTASGITTTYLNSLVFAVAGWFGDDVAYSVGYPGGYTAVSTSRRDASSYSTATSSAARSVDPAGTATGDKTFSLGDWTPTEAAYVAGLVEFIPELHRARGRAKGYGTASGHVISLAGGHFVAPQVLGATQAQGVPDTFDLAAPAERVVGKRLLAFIAHTNELIGGTTLTAQPPGTPTGWTSITSNTGTAENGGNEYGVANRWLTRIADGTSADDITDLTVSGTPYGTVTGFMLALDVTTLPRLNVSQTGFGAAGGYSITGSSTVYSRGVYGATVLGSTLGTLSRPANMDATSYLEYETDTAETAMLGMALATKVVQKEDSGTITFAPSGWGTQYIGRGNLVVVAGDTVASGGNGRAKGRGTADSTVIAGTVTVTADQSDGQSHGYATATAQAIITTGVAHGRSTGRATATASVVTATVSQGFATGRGTATGISVVSGAASGRAQGRATATGTPYVTGAAQGYTRGRGTAAGSVTAIATASGRSRAYGTASGTPTAIAAAHGRSQARGVATGATIVIAAAQGRSFGRATADAIAFYPGVTVTADPAAGRSAGRGTASALVTTSSTAQGNATGRGTATATATTSSVAVGRGRGRAVSVGTVVVVSAAQGWAHGRQMPMSLGIAVGTARGYAHGRAAATGATIVVSAAVGWAHARQMPMALGVPLGTAQGWAHARGTAASSSITTTAAGHGHARGRSIAVFAEVGVVTGQAQGWSRARGTATAAATTTATAVGRSTGRGTATAFATTTLVAQGRAKGRASATPAVIVVTSSRGYARGRGTVVASAITTTASARGHALARSSVMWLEVGYVTGEATSYGRAFAAASSSVTSLAQAQGHARGRAAASSSAFLHTGTAHGRARGRATADAISFYPGVQIQADPAVGRARGRGAASGLSVTVQAAHGRARATGRSTSYIICPSAALGHARGRSNVAAASMTTVAQARAYGRSWATSQALLSIVAYSAHGHGHGWHRSAANPLLVQPNRITKRGEHNPRYSKHGEYNPTLTQRGEYNPVLRK